MLLLAVICFKWKVIVHPLLIIIKPAVQINGSFLKISHDALSIELS